MTTIEDLNNLELWNRSRSIAADAIDAVMDNMEHGSHGVAITRHDINTDAVETEFHTHKSKHEFWPFENTDDLITQVERKTEFDRSRNHIDALTEEIKSRLLDDSVPGDNEDDNGGGENSEATPTHQSQENTSSETKPNGGSTPEENSSKQITTKTPPSNEKTTHNIAKDMYYCFLGDEKHIRYPQIEEKYQIKLPDRSIALTKIMNLSGSTEERIAKTEEWVQTWYGDGQAVDRMNTSRRMGMGGV